MIKSILILTLFVVCTLCDDPPWTQIPGQFSAVSTKGNEVWALSALLDWQAKIYRLNNNSQLQTIPLILKDKSIIKGTPKFIAATEDGWTWAIIGPFGDDPALYRWNPTQNFWEPIKTDVPVFMINAYYKDSAIGIYPKHDATIGIVLYKNGVWENVPALPNTTVDKPTLSVAIGENGDRWAIAGSLDAKIYHWSGSQWNLIPAAGQVNMGFLDVENSDRVVLDSLGNVSVWVASNKSWKPIVTPTSPALSASINKNSIYYVDGHGQMFMAKI